MSEDDKRPEMYRRMEEAAKPYDLRTLKAVLDVVRYQWSRCNGDKAKQKGIEMVGFHIRTWAEHMEKSEKQRSEGGGDQADR